jgi:hypothetical protein
MADERASSSARQPLTGSGASNAQEQASGNTAGRLLDRSVRPAKITRRRHCVSSTAARSAARCTRSRAPVMAAGARVALNLDAGGSTTLWWAGTVVNRPSDGAARVVANHLGVVARGAGAWDAAKAAPTSPR